MNSHGLPGGRIGRGGVRLLAAAGAVLILSGLTAGTAVAQGGAKRAEHGAAHAAGRAAASTLAAQPSDSPSGFWYGTDSWPMTVTGNPYREPVIGSDYGGYIGMTGSWSAWLGCRGSRVAWSSTNSQQANANYASHLGVGTGVYWFMGGPGVDPHYNGTSAEAYAWGEQQAARTLYDIGRVTVKYPVVWMDVELPGIAPAPDNGWNSVYTSPCSGIVKTHSISPAVDRSVFDGYAAYLTSHSSYKAGVYSAQSVWTAIFGTGSASSITNTYEWTYTDTTSSLAHVPDGWCLAGTRTCGHFFGGISQGSQYAVMWQWSGGGGTYNGYGDFDQIDANRTP